MNTLAHASQRRTHRPPQIGLGQPPETYQSHVKVLPPRSAFSSTFPQSNTELILYSYAQLTGTLSIIPIPGAIPTPDQTHTLNGLRSALKQSVVGGGSMDITSSLHHQGHAQQPLRRSHSRSSSFSSGLLSLLAPSSSGPQNSPTPWTPSHRPRTPFVFSSLIMDPSPANGSFPNGKRVGLGIGGIDEDVDPESPLPMFEVQPAMLAVDMSLLPGESRSCAWSSYVHLVSRVVVITKPMLQTHM